MNIMLNQQSNYHHLEADWYNKNNNKAEINRLSLGLHYGTLDRIISWDIFVGRLFC